MAATGARADPTVCAHCGRTDPHGKILIPIGAARERGGVLAWICPDEWPAWYAARKGAGTGHGDDGDD